MYLTLRETASAKSELSFEASIDFKPFVILIHEPNV
jgi:hypothetical protein